MIRKKKDRRMDEMKVKHMVLLAILMGIVWASTACDTPGISASSASPTPTLSPRASRARVVSAEGEVVPVKEAELSGEVVARLAQADWQQKVEEAEAALELAEAQLAQAGAGARSEEVAAAREALAAAQAGVVSAQASLASAEAELAKLEVGAKPEELIVARAAMDKAAVALQLAQSEYDKIAWQSGLGATQQAVVLRQASDDYESAKAEYEALVKGARAEELEMARAAVEAARAQVEGAEAQAGQAKARLDLLLAGPAAEAIAVAEAQVQQARTVLKGARIALEKTVLMAPLSGTVGAVMVEEGETVMAGAPVVVIGDLGALRVETDDLSEVDVVGVAVGQEVEVSVDAMPDLELHGWVSEVAPMAEERHGDIVYTVTIDLEEGLEAGLRWGMTAYVDIVVGG
jgi:multidrug resistance efflux pump